MHRARIIKRSFEAEVVGKIGPFGGVVVTEIWPISPSVPPSALFDLGVGSIGLFARLGCPNRRGTPVKAPFFDLAWLLNLA